MDDAEISFKAYDSFNNVGQPEPWTDAAPLNGVYDAGEEYDDINGHETWDADRGIEGVGASGEVVISEILDSWGLMTPYLASLLVDNDVLNLQYSTPCPYQPTYLTLRRRSS